MEWWEEKEMHRFCLDLVGFEPGSITDYLCNLGQVTLHFCPIGELLFLPYRSAPCIK